MGVPAAYIKDAPVDWDGEILASAGVCLRVGKTNIPPPSIGTWSMLEAADCDFYHPARERTAWGSCLAYYIMANRRAAADPLAGWLARGRRDISDDDVRGVDPFEAIVSRDCVRAGLSVQHHVGMARLLDGCFAGYAMIPTMGDSTAGLYVYGLDTLACVVAGVGHVMGIPWDVLIWDTPMVVVGHVAAQVARNGGKKGVSRPKDQADITRQLALCKEREDAGLLHPWEEDHPLMYGARPNLTQAEHHRLAELQIAARAAQEAKDA